MARTQMKMVNTRKTPHGDGNAGQKIAEILSSCEVAIQKQLLSNLSAQWNSWA